MLFACYDEIIYVILYLVLVEGAYVYNSGLITEAEKKTWSINKKNTTIHIKMCYI